jgi:RNA polymerase sigma-70 factor (ECF subfamily)
VNQKIHSADEDARLMERLARGDRSALARLVQLHQREVLALAFRTTGDWSLAEDIGQETFLRVWRSAARYEPRALFSTWLYRIVVNLSLDALKKRKPITGDPPAVADISGHAPSAALEGRDLAAAVQQAVAGLPERQRVAVVLHRFSGLSMREIARTTGWSESAVESLLVRAYAALRNRLKNLVDT